MMKSLIFIGISIYIFLGENINLTSANEQPEVTRENINLTSANEQPEVTNTSDIIPPALTCVVIGDLACNRMCKMVGHVYATPVNPAKCNSSNICECSTREHNYLDDIWRDKFTSTQLMNEIKTDKLLYRKIFDLMRSQLKTREQTKRELKRYLTDDQFAQIQVNDRVAENMIKYDDDDSEKNELNRDNIRAYVSKNLQSDPLGVPTDFDYKAKFINALENASNEDMVQYIIHDVRQSKNLILNELVDNFLKEKNMTEDKDIDDDDDNDTLPDILDLMIVSEFITPTPIDQQNRENSSDKNAITDATSSNGSNQWDLPDLDVVSVQQFEDGYKCWKSETHQYNVCQFKPIWGDHSLEWKKGNVSVDITTYKTGKITQEWKFADGVNISITKESNGDFKQNWNFDSDMKLTYAKTGNAVVEEWSNERKDEQILAKYKSLIDSWCDKNRIFIDEKSCIIY